MSEQTAPQPQQGQPSTPESPTLAELRRRVQEANAQSATNRLSKGGKARRGSR